MLGRFRIVKDDSRRQGVKEEARKEEERKEQEREGPVRGEKRAAVEGQVRRLGPVS